MLYQKKSSLVMFHQMIILKMATELFGSKSRLFDCIIHIGSLIDFASRFYHCEVDVTINSAIVATILTLQSLLIAAKFWLIPSKKGATERQKPTNSFQ